MKKNRLTKMCIAIVMNSLLLSGCSMTNSVDDKQYTNIFVRKGPLGEEVSLDSQAQDDLCDLLLSQNLPITYECPEKEEILYGGPSFQIGYSHDNRNFFWQMGVNGVSCFITDADGTVHLEPYSRQEILLQEVEAIINKGGLNQ